MWAPVAGGGTPGQAGGWGGARPAGICGRGPGCLPGHLQVTPPAYIPPDTCTVMATYVLLTATLGSAGCGYIWVSAALLY